MKRAIRTHPRFTTSLQGHVGQRSRQFEEHLASRLAAPGRTVDAARAVVKAVLEANGIKQKGDATAVLLYLSPGDVDKLEKVIGEHFDAIQQSLASHGRTAGEEPGGESVSSQEQDAAGADAARKAPPASKRSSKKAGAKAKNAKAAKEAARVLPPEVASLFASALGGATDAADIALFGRMVAEHKGLNIDAACQVAHAISTHATQIEMDFYTAVDDLQASDDPGAGMMGIVEYQSACFYRYALVDLEQLTSNLGGDAALAARAVVAFCQASVEAIPTGKQNSMAAQNPPSYVRLKLRSGGAPWSLANAFVDPVRATARGGVVRASIEALEAYDQRLRAMYGDDGHTIDLVASTEPADRPERTTEGTGPRLPLAGVWLELNEALQVREATATGAGA